MSRYYRTKNIENSSKWVVVDDTFLQSLEYQISVGNTLIQLPYKVGDLVIVWGTQRVYPQYLGRITKVFGNKVDFPRIYYRYNIEKPDGSSDNYVDSDFVEQNIPDKINDMIDWANYKIREASNTITKLSRIRTWARLGETGWFNREYQNKPPKRSRVKSKNSG